MDVESDMVTVTAGNHAVITAVIGKIWPECGITAVTGSCHLVILWE